MTNKKLRTKIIYILIIVALLLPLLVLGRPASVQKGEEGQIQLSDGYLANLRRRENITDAQLGKIDPGSSTMKLATFGMRGVALAMLWHKSLEYEKKFDWNNVVVTSNQITMLEPRFISVWDYLGWRLAYNASANQDDYRERYRWVIRGFEFLEEGTHYNRKAPFLYHKAGWTISQKIGIADEKEQYRQLFREDNDFHDAHGTPSLEDRDNWLFGIPWYKKSEELFLAAEESFFAQKAAGLLNDDQVKDYYDGGKKLSIDKMCRPVFMANSRMNRIHYADWYEQDGSFGEKAQYNWAAAQREWDEFGDLEITTTIDDRNNPGEKRIIHLKEAEETQKIIDELNEELLALLAPRTKKDLYVERWNSLKEQQQSTFVSQLKTSNEEHFVAIREYLNETRPDWEAELTELRNALFEDEPEELAAFLMPEPIRKGARGIEQTDERDEINMAQKASRAIDEVRSQAASMLILTPQAIAGDIASYESRQREAYQDYLAKLEENPDLANDPDFKVVEPPTRNAPRAREINRLIEVEKSRHQLSDMFCGLVNYVHYGQETEVEQTQEAINANEMKFIARRAFNKEGNIFRANDYYLESMREWRQLMENPRYDYLLDDLFRRDFMDFVDRYRYVTTKLDDSERGDLYPENFPFEPVVRLELSRQSIVDSLHESLLYLQDRYDKGNYEEVAERSLLLLQTWDNLMMGYEYLPHVPVPEYRDEVVETFALYVNSLEKTEQEFAPDVPLIDFINKVMYYDPLTREALQKTSQIDWTMPEGEPTSAEVIAAKEALLEQLRNAAFDWNLVVAQFPILKLPTSAYVDPSVNFFNTSHLRDCRDNQIAMINDAYRSLSQELNRPITTDYPLHELLPKSVPVMAPSDAPIPQEPTFEPQPQEQPLVNNAETVDSAADSTDDSVTDSGDSEEPDTETSAQSTNDTEEQTTSSSEDGGSTPADN